MPQPDANAELEVLLRIERKISALLSISVDQHLRSTDALAKPRPRSIDRLLSDAGLLGTEIAATLGKSPQAVSQSLKSDGKSSPGAQARKPSKGQEENEVSQAEGQLGAGPPS